MTLIHGSHTHRTGQGWLTYWTPEKVVNAPDPAMAWAEYVQQTMGVPYPTIRDMTVLRRKITDFFDHHPQADFYTLCRVAGWCRSRNRRFQRIWMVVDAFRDAYVAGALPELQPVQHDENLEAGITDALAQETDPAWRRRLLMCAGDARRDALQEWRDSGRA
jgi:hypothetical protein